jgi:hypothetical protein
MRHHLSRLIFRLCLVLSVELTALPATGQALVMATRPDPTFPFYEAVLRAAAARLQPPAPVEILPEMPQPRIETMLDDGRLTLHAFVAVDSRDRRWVPVPVDLTGGLIGQRVLVVRTGEAETFAALRTVDDLRRHVGAFGRGWGDVAIWQTNGLPYQEYDGDWSRIYTLLLKGDRGISYFSRAAHEALPELTRYSETGRLTVAPGILVRYQRDMQFYLSPAAADRWLQPLTEALRAMTADGALAALVAEEPNWSAARAPLNLPDRHVIDLVTPPLSLRESSPPARP